MSDPTNISVIPPPLGTKSNFINPVDQLTAIYVTSGIVLALPAIGIAARLFVKLVVVPGSHRTEDYLSYFAFASFVSYVAVILHLSGMGLTHHLYDISVAQISGILYWVNIVYCLYSIPTAAAKLSVLFQLRSIFTTGNRNAVYWVIMVSIVVNFIFYTGLFFSYVFQCWPREKIWHGDTVAGKCTDAIQVNLSSGILNIVSDIEALLIPTWAIWHLSLPLKRKLAALSVFGVSSIAIGVGIGGMYIRVTLLTNIDQTWWLTKLALLVTAEISIVIFVGCMPSFSRLYHYVRGTGPSNQTTTKSKSGLVTFGSSENKAKSGKGGKGGNLSNTMARYMGTRGTGMTTLGSQGGFDNEDTLELRTYVTSTANAGGAVTPATDAQMDDLENGGQAAVSNPSGAPNHIWKTSQVGQTYSRLSDDEWSRRV
ncbi:uncharacterized protein N0V89_012127 [Didymosphaeria variabile]|uniref:Rhodopsin domain-containing protein n=1 Tax=Didymosphaeria variabile TaxID=1932322 RepID=A0A9W8X8K2_9PLEO|nr:uncharacterized protein N0V89_012127 [Didymosphaeria variabile]KAJ4344387.1 hypothetical protein N0V89_012127 [Didymosphaeria variabile]